MMMLLDILLKAIITALVVAPVVNRYNQWKKNREYRRRLKKFGGWQVVVEKRVGGTKKDVGSEVLSVDEAEMLHLALKTVKGRYIDVSMTKTRQLLQSIVSGLGERTDNIIDRTVMDIDNRKFIITL